MTNYQVAKMALKERAKDAKEDFGNDRAAIRMVINDDVHFLSSDLDLTDYQRDLLSNYACKLHPKD